MDAEMAERVDGGPFAHQFGTGGLRRIFVRSHANVRKRRLIQLRGFILGLRMRHLTRVVTPRSLQRRALARAKTLSWGGNWPLDVLGSVLGTLLRTDPAQFAVLGYADRLLVRLKASVQKEH